MIDRILHDEHLSTLNIINKIEIRIGNGKWSRRLDSAVSADKSDLEKLMSIMDDEVCQHLPFEEKVLFPKLNERGFEDITNMLFEEHEAIRSLVRVLKPAVHEALTHGFNEDTWTVFTQLFAELTGVVIFHIQKEEMGVISRLQMLLGVEACQNMATSHTTFVAEKSMPALS